MSIVGTVEEISCLNSADGAIDITVSGGVGPYVYAWSNGATSEDLADLAPGAYTVTVTDLSDNSTISESFDVDPGFDLFLNANSNPKDVTCVSGKDGTLQLVITAGSGPYTYDWRDKDNNLVGSNSLLKNVTAGLYTLTVTGKNNEGVICSAVKTFEVEEPAPVFTVTPTITDASCKGSADGTISLTVISSGNGNGKFVYTWDHGESGESIANLAAGTYRVLIEDNKNCEYHTFTIAEPEELILSTDATPISCLDNEDGAIDLSVSGGVAPYTYAWDNGEVSEDLSGLAMGSYDVIVTDANGCQANASATILGPTPILISSNVNHVTCNGDTSGLIKLVVTGGAEGYTYQWSNGESTAGIGNITAGDYTVTVTDANGCFETETITITEPSPINIAISQNNVDCNGASTGSIDVTVTGGVGGYVYNWSNGATTPDISDLAAGTYTLEVTDGNACIESVDIEITEPDVLTLSSSITDNVCFGEANGSIDLSVSGGAGGYTYAWSNGETTEDLSSLSAGTYTVVVTDANGCSADLELTISEPPALKIIAGHSNVTCKFGDDGSIDIQITGGTGSYNFNWSNGQTSQNLIGLTAGNYSVVVTDEAGCTANATITVSEPATAIEATAEITDADCFGSATGAIDISVDNAVAPITYLWSNGITTKDLNDVPAGNYSLTITDAIGCTFIDDLIINQPAQLTLSTTQVDVLCNGAATGSIDLTVSGGVGPYSYVWDNGETTEDLLDLSAGTYAVEVTDANGCLTSTNLIITEPSALSLSYASIQASCNGVADGSIDLSVTGGLGPYSYTWDTGSTNEDIDDLAAGSYDVVVTDANGCSDVLTAIVEEPAPVVIAEVVTDAGCFGGNAGAIDVSITGGTAPYSYAWSNGANTEDISTLTYGSYTLTVEDAAGCSVSKTISVSEDTSIDITPTVVNVDCNGSATGAISLNVVGGNPGYIYRWTDDPANDTPSRSNLSAGNYEVTIEDSAGCTSVINVAVTEPERLVLTTNQVNVDCHGSNTGSINLIVNGGVGPYRYDWNAGLATSEDLSNLAVGNYSVLVTDDNGCTATASVTITEPDPISLTTSISDVDCNGNATGSIDLSASGGTGAFSYSWSNGSTSQDISDLTAGNYSVTVTDEKGCSETLAVTINEPTALSVDVSQTNVLCHGGSQGAADLTVAGGTAPYAFAWSNGQTTEDLNNISVGTYTVEVTDANGCIISTSVTISEPTAMAATVNIIDVACNGDATGSIDLNVTGGTGAYRYLWSNGATTQNISGLVAGDYSVTIEDANGCQLEQVYSVNEGVAITLSSTIIEVSCPGGNDGFIDLTASGGTGLLSYSWNGGIHTSEDINNLTAGEYTVVVTDGVGCSASATITVPEPEAITIAENIIAVACKGDASGAIDIVVSGGTAPYSYLWSNGSTSQNIINLSAGAYSVEITDANNCVFNFTGINVSEPTTNITVAPAVNDISCFGADDGSVNLNAAGGTGPITFLWSNGATTEDLSNLPPGNYSVTLTDENGCLFIDNIQINEPSELAITLSATDVLCNGAGNGAINLVVVGGTGPYTYSWSNGATSEDLENLLPGNYSVLVSDANDCSVNAEITISEPPVLELSVVGSNVNCNGGDDGSVNLTASGGIAPYSYSWSNGSTTQDLNDIPAGYYSVNVTDANGCIQTIDVNITEPDTDISASYVVTDVLCKGESTGGVELSVSGGTAPYTYLWDFGATTKNVDQLPAGVYSVTITDANSCMKITGITISEPAAELTVNGLTTDLTCFEANNGQVNLTVRGGTAPYSYSWSNGETSQNINGLSIGTYSVDIVDANGCSVAATYTLAQPDELILSSSRVDLLCNGDDDGKIDLNIVGGLAPYHISWSNGENTEDLSNLLAGSYTVTVTDDNGCIATLTETIEQPEALVINANTVNAACNGGTDGEIDLTVTGGVGPYTYSWLTGETTQDLNNLSLGNYTVTVTDVNGCSLTEVIAVNENGSIEIDLMATNVSCLGASDGAIDLVVSGGTPPFTFTWSNGETTEDISNLSMGVYSVIVTDITGCSSTIEAEIIEPEPIDIMVEKRDITCFGEGNGILELTLTGGTPPYTFAVTLNPGNALNIEVSDSQGCTNASYAVQAQEASHIDAAAWSVQGNILTVSNLPEDTFEVVRVDQGNAIIASETILEPEELNVTADLIHIACNGEMNGAIELTVTGGTGNYTYNWSHGATTRKLQHLASGNYSVEISDGNNCLLYANYTLRQPEALVNAANVVNVVCFESSTGSINTNVSGGTGPYSYAWSHGATTSSISDLAAGTYQLQIMDASGCSLTETYVVTQPDELTATGVVSDLNCFEDGSGEINLSVTGGSGIYSYDWSNGATTKDLSGLSAGTYSVIITDENGCLINKNFNLSQPQQLLVSGATTDLNCYGANNGSIDLTVVGGTAPYSFNWSNGVLTEDLNAIAAGQYSVEVMDANGCVVVSNFEITQPDELIVQVNKQDILCAGEGSGSIELQIIGGTPSYQISWDHGSTDANLYDLSPGIYEVTVTDAEGCSVTERISIFEPEPIVITENINHLSCAGDLSGHVSLQVTGGVQPYTYAWSNGASTPLIANLSGGTYQLTLTDANGCAQTIDYVVNEPEPFEAYAVQNLVIDCENRIVQDYISIVSSGGTGQSFVQWSDTGFQLDHERAFDEEGVQEINVRDENGCLINITVNIALPELGSASATIIDGTTDPFGNYTLNMPISFSSEMSDNITSFTWDFGDGTTSDQENPEHIYTDIGVFTVTLTTQDANGCVLVNELQVSVNLGYEIIMPTAFTPNKDNLNDRLYPEFYGLKDLKLVIYNSWGDVIFVSETLESGGWDGTVRNQEAPAGGYVYKLFAYSVSGRTIEKTGSFLLIKK